MTGTTTTLTLLEDLFLDNDYVYVDNFYFISGGTLVNMSGSYLVSSHTYETSYTNKSTINIVANTNGLITKGKPKASYYKGMNINVLRSYGEPTSTLADRYTITKKLL